MKNKKKSVKKKQKKLVRIDGIVGYFVKETMTGTILYQPFNGPKGAYVFVPMGVFVGSRAEVNKIAKDFDDSFMTEF